MRKTRLVNVSERASKRRSRGMMWAYGYADIAALLGSTPAAVKQRRKRGWEPSLEAVCEAYVAMLARRKVA